ncbi:MAG: helix-turn-helix transcriptional regulator [Sphingobacteriaceae bacterium]
MNRIDRISAILIQLQSRRVIRAQDIAERFDISLRTVYRDIRVLEEAGVPLIGEAGIGYSLAAGYRLPPVMFTQEETIAFLTAEKLVEQLTDGANGANFKSAMYKIKAVLKTGEKDLLSEMDGAIQVLRAKKTSGKPDLDLIQPILKSISERRAVTIQYFAHYRQTHSERCIEPIGVFFLDNYWHLIAFCRMRSDYRDFRLDRISGLSPGNQPFLQKHPDLKSYLGQVYKEKNLMEVVIRINVSAAKYFGEEKFYHGFVTEKRIGNELEMRFLTESIEGFARWFIMFADQAFIIEPAVLRDRISCILAAAIQNFQQGKSC